MQCNVKFRERLIIYLYKKHTCNFSSNYLEYHNEIIKKVRYSQYKRSHNNIFIMSNFQLCCGYVWVILTKKAAKSEVCNHLNFRHVINLASYVTYNASLQHFYKRY